MIRQKLSEWFSRDQSPVAVIENEKDKFSGVGYFKGLGTAVAMGCGETDRKLYRVQRIDLENI